MHALAFFVLFFLQQQPPQPPPPCTPDGDGKVKFVCGQQAPEDLVVLPGGEWVAASVFGGAGRIRLINTRDMTVTNAYPTATSEDRLDKKTYDTCPGPPDEKQKAQFRTHGIAVRPGTNSTHTLYAVHHGVRESIEVFQVDMRSKTPTLTWIGCAVPPDPIGLNEVVPLPGGGFAATNYLIRGPEAAANRTKMMAGENNGEIWEWHTGTGWKIIPGSEASGANGLEISKDGKWLYVAAWGNQSFYRLSLGQTPPKRDNIPLGFRVDNIRWAADGTLLATGQGGMGQTQTTNIVKINPDSLKVQELVTHPNSPAFGAGTVAVEVGKELWVGSFRGDRIARFPAPAK